MSFSKELASAFDSETFGRDGSFHLDKPVGSASISPCGRDIVLASRQGLHIIDLDSPYAPPRHLAHHTPWEVADVQWSPFADRDHWVVSTSNQKALVWNLNMVNTTSSIEHVLHGHKRAITDINFSAHHPDILATCAVDSYVLCWDLRRPTKQPAMTFCDWFAGATQVKWNRIDSNILASSHDKFLKIWDIRKGAHALKTIAAHKTKIYGVDWDRRDARKLATCSLDQTVKLWNYSHSDEEPDTTICTPFPVWRARYTPFGSGLVALPQRGDHDLHLYDRRQDFNGPDNTAKPSHRFSGHRDQVKEFLWRPRGTVTDSVDDREFQLVSWGTDRLLRLHEVNNDVLATVGYTKGMEIERKFNFTRRGAPYKTFRDAPTHNEDQDFPAFFSTFGDSHDTMSGPSQGMKGGAITGAHGYGTRGFMSSIDNTKTASPKNLDPVSWMRGVRIGKRAASPSGFVEGAGSLMSPDLKPTAMWDVFETLGEEITSSLDKFPNVKPEHIDVQRRRLSLSFSGPWALNNASAQLRCRFDFPKSYPAKAAPSMTLDKNVALDNDTITKINNDVAELADRFLSQQRHSLEAILRYLLGEHSLEESLSWLSNSGDPDNQAIAIESSSSDDDEDEVSRYVPPTSNGAETHDSAIAVNNTFYNVPIAKTCGAHWSNTGHLVCFFPAKQGKEPSLLSQSLSGEARLRGKELFEGFGRLQRSHQRKRPTSTLETVVTDDSDDESFELSSSSDSSSSGVVGLQTTQLRPIVPWAAFGGAADQDLALDTSQKSVGETGQPSTAASKTTAFISIHNLQRLIPVKEELGRRYKIRRGYETAIENADIAEDEGFSELADIWHMCALMLEDTKTGKSTLSLGDSKEQLSEPDRSSPTLPANDSAVDLSHDDDDSFPSLQMYSVANSLTQQRFVSSLLQYYEVLGDVQTLAMLSCVLDQESDLLRRSSNSQNAIPKTSNVDELRTGLDSKRRNITLNTYPTPLSSEQTRQQRQLEFPKIANLQQLKSLSASGASSVSPASSLDSTSSPDLKAQQAGFTGLSLSPEDLRTMPRTNPSMTASITSMPRAFQNIRSATSSPPSGFPKKPPNSAGAYQSFAQPSVAWTPSHWISRSSTNASDESRALLPVSDTEENDVSGELDFVEPPHVSCVSLNQDQFYNDRFPNVPLLDPEQHPKYRLWRESYAHLLGVWDLPIERTEILNFNTMSIPRSTNELSGVRPSHASVTAEKMIEVTEASDLPLKVAMRCTNCSAFTPSNRTKSSKACQNCHRHLRPPKCTLCNKSILGLAAPCLRCGHSLHFACRKKVLTCSSFGAQDTRNSYNCLTGCGCICSEQDVINVEHSQPVEAAPMSQGPQRPSFSHRAPPPHRKVSATASLFSGGASPTASFAAGESFGSVPGNSSISDWEMRAAVEGDTSTASASTTDLPNEQEQAGWENEAAHARLARMLTRRSRGSGVVGGSGNGNGMEERMREGAAGSRGPRSSASHMWGKS